MFKKFLVGTLAAVLMVEGALATATTAEAAKAPKAKYTFDMNKANKNVVAVARKGDDASYTTGGTPVWPEASNAKKIKLKYAKGKNGKALHLDRSSSYAAELKNVKLGSGSWSVAFWIKTESSMSNYMAAFFTASDITEEKAQWLSVTKTDFSGDLSPVIWSRNAAKNEFPWYSNNDWAEGVNKITADAGWQHIIITVDTKDTCEYGAKGDEGYVKSYHAYTYLNGELFGNGVCSMKMSNKNRFFLGMNAWDCPFKGYFDDVQLWDKALTDKQAAAVYKAVK